MGRESNKTLDCVPPAYCLTFRPFAHAFVKGAQSWRGHHPFIVSSGNAEVPRTLLFKSALPNAARVYAAAGGGGVNKEITRSIAGYILTKQLTRIVASDLTSDVRLTTVLGQERVERVGAPAWSRWRPKLLGAEPNLTSRAAGLAAHREVLLQLGHLGSV